MNQTFQVRYYVCLQSKQFIYAYCQRGNLRFVLNTVGVLPYLFDTMADARVIAKQNKGSVYLAVNPKHQNHPDVNK